MNSRSEFMPQSKDPYQFRSAQVLERNFLPTTVT